MARSGCVSCLTALGHHGAWLPRGSVLRCRLADGQRDRVAGALKGCRPFGANPAVARAIDDVETAFRCALRCAGAEDLVAVADSLVHRRIATLEQLRAWSTGAPASRRRLLDLVDAASGSGTESMVRLRLRGLRIRCRTQVVLWRGRRVDPRRVAGHRAGPPRDRPPRRPSVAWRALDRAERRVGSACGVTARPGRSSARGAASEGVGVP